MVDDVEEVAVPHRIAEAAGLSGVPATTIRYYEDQGLIRPARAANGYRTFDDRDLAQLRFLGRARTLDLPVDDLRDLVELWEDDECAPVADRLRDTVAQRLVDTQERVADLMALAGDLQQVLAGMERVPPHEGPCVEGECVCLDPDPDPSADHHLPLVPGADDIACTLDPSDMPERAADWRRLVGRATGQHPIEGGVALHFPMDPDLASTVTALAAAEHDCCSFFGFALRVTAAELHLEVTGPADARPVITTMFGLPGEPLAAPA